MENTLRKDVNFRYILAVKLPDVNGLWRSVRGLGVEKLRGLKQSVSAVCVVYVLGMPRCALENLLKIFSDRNELRARAQIVYNFLINTFSFP